MIEKITYIAFDGSEFADEDECIDYENELNFRAFKDHVFLFDDERKPMPFSLANFEACFYVTISDDHAAASFVAAMEAEGYTELPRAKGVYEYNARKDEWENLHEKLAGLTELIEELAAYE